MKKFKLTAVGAVISLLFLIEPAVLASESFKFTPEDRKISINIEIEAPKTAFADILIMESDVERDDIVAENLDFNKFFYKKAYTTG